MDRDKILEQIGLMQSQLEKLKFEVMKMEDMVVEEPISPDFTDAINELDIKEAIELFIMYIVANEKI